MPCHTVQRKSRLREARNKAQAGAQEAGEEKTT
jgi:hypothetical protein